MVVSKNHDYVVAICNSSVMLWFARQLLTSKQGGFFEFLPVFLKQLPVPAATAPEQAELELLTRRLTKLKTEGIAGEKVAVLEEQVNDSVADLFRLTPEERRLIAER